MALFPVVRWVVQYLKDQWPVIVKLIPAPFLANLTAIAANLGLASYVGATPSQAVVVGVLTGMFSMLYHDFKKPAQTTTVIK